MKRFFKMFLFIIPMSIVLFGCGSDFLGIAYKTMYTTGVSYDTGMKATVDLYVSGKLDKEKLDKIVKVAGKVKIAYNAAVTALSVYEKANSTENKDVLQAAMNEMNKIWAELKTLIEEFAPDILKSFGVEKLSKDINELNKVCSLTLEKEAI